jgi:neutral ceramidase
VTCDLRSFVSPRVTAEARKRFGIETTIISSSHTHSGPLTWELRSPWYAQAEEKMLNAIGAAQRNLFPATLAFARGESYLGFNRRKVVNGRAEMWWRNAEKLPSSPLDPTLNVLVIRGEDNQPRGILVNYACHPSILGPDNLGYSADYPGALRHEVETRIPNALLLFVQGGAGDINPYRDKEPVDGEGFSAVEEMGISLGSEVAGLVAKAEPVSSSPLKTMAETVKVGHRWKRTESIDTGIAAGLLGGDVCFLALPGEPFIEHQITFRVKSECAHAMLFGYSYSADGVWAGYLPTMQAAVEGGYGADYNTTVEVGTGERLIDRGVVDLFRLRGLLKDLPEGSN